MTAIAFCKSIMAPLERIKITMQVVPMEKGVRDVSKFDFL
jgi:hypothetical protein